MAINWNAETKKLSELKDYDRNPRKMGGKQFDDLVRSIKEDGYHQRLLINLDGTIIGGHQRKKALLKAGFTKNSEIEVLTPSRALTSDEFDRINIRDNLGYGAYDFEILANNFEAEQLIDWGMPEEWLISKKEDIEISDEDDSIPDEVTEPKTKLGDIWILGDHRLVCGDATNATDVQKLLKNESPMLMVTDPPYGVNYDPSWREGHGLKVGKHSKGIVTNDHTADWKDAYSLFPGNVAYIWHSALYTHIFAQNIIDCGFELKSNIIWAKQHFAISRGDYHWKHEPCWYAVRKGEKHRYNGARDQSTIWEIKSNNFGNPEKEEMVGHGTQKPIECMMRPILNNSVENEFVYDPFGGSGTTLIACEKSNRKCLMMELSPNYCDMIISRWEKVSKQTAILEICNE